MAHRRHHRRLDHQLRICRQQYDGVAGGAGTVSGMVFGPGDVLESVEISITRPSSAVPLTSIAW